MAKHKSLFLFISLVLGSLGASTAYTVDLPAPDFIPTPCAPESGTGSTSYLRKCSEVEPYVVGELKKQIRQAADSMYKDGQSIDTTVGVDYSQSAAKIDNSKAAHQKFVKPACDLIANPLNDNKVEADNNHFGESCGEHVGMNVSTHSNGTADVIWDLNRPKGAREAAYYGGAFIQAMACYMAQVEKEITTKKGLGISPSCRAAAVAIRDLGQKNVDVAAGLRAELENEPALREIKGMSLSDCTEDQRNDWDKSGKAVGLDRGRLKQAKMKLCAARAAQESMFAQMMRCEVFARAGTDFRASMISGDEFFKTVQQGPGNECRSSCANSCKSSACVKKRRFKVSFDKGKCDACATNCAQSCFPEKLKNFMRDRLKRWDQGDPNSVCQRV